MAIAALVSCSKEDDVQGPALDSANKTVSITIANALPSSRAAYTGDETAAQGIDQVAKGTDLKVLFADKDGKILCEKSLIETGTTDDTHTNIAEGQYVPATSNPGDTEETPFEEGTFTWHNVPWAVTQIAVVRYEAGDITIKPEETNLSAVLALATNESVNVGREANDIVLYSVGKLTDSNSTHRVGDVIYHVWKTEVTVRPALARFEISQISCTDLGTHPDTGVEYSFDELDILSMVWTDAKKDTYAAPVKSVENWRNAETATSMIGTLYGVHTAAATAPTNCTNNTTRSAATVLTPETGVWSWNIDPEQTQFASMTVDIKAYSYKYSLDNNSTPLEIIGLNTSANQSEDNVTFEAGKVYKMALDFVEQNITDEDKLCVQVKVTIADWAVQTVFPVFQNK